MFEKIKKIGKKPLIIGVALLSIIVIALAVLIGINIKKSKARNIEISNAIEVSQDLIEEEEIIVTEFIDQEEDLEYQEEKEEKTEQNEETEKYTQSNVNAPTYFIRVNYGQNVVTIYTKDQDGNYTVPYKVMVCSTGTATPRSGTYTIPSGTYSRGTWGMMVGNVWAQYFTRIKGSILFHSVPYTERNKWSLEYWEYDKLGTAASAGCVRLTVENAKWIYNNCPSGTKVEFYTDSNPGPLGKPTAQKISEHELVRGWDPTDPDGSNPWKTYNPNQEETEQNDSTVAQPEEEVTTPSVPAPSEPPITPTAPTTPTTPNVPSMPEDTPNKENSSEENGSQGDNQSMPVNPPSLEENNPENEESTDEKPTVPEQNPDEKYNSEEDGNGESIPPIEPSEDKN